MNETHNHAFVKTVMTLYDQAGNELASKEFSVEPNYGTPQHCFTRFFQSRRKAKKFSIRCHYADGCVRDWE